MSTPQIDWSEKRAAARKQFSVKGWLRLPNGFKVGFRTTDASPLGLGVEHDDLVAAGTRGLLALALLDTRGQPAIFQAEAEIRHSVLSGGRWRSGVQFTSVHPDHRQLLDRVLRSKLSLFDSASAD